MDLSYYLKEVRCHLLFAEVRLYCHPRYERKELLYVSHFRCKVDLSSSNRSTFLSINRILDYLDTEPLLVCPPILILLKPIYSTYLYISFYSIFQECSVEHFVVLDEFVVKFSTPLDLGKTEGLRINGVNNLAIDSTCGTLFYFGELEL